MLDILKTHYVLWRPQHWHHAKTSLIRVTKIQHTNLENSNKRKKSATPLLILFNLLTVNHLYWDNSSIYVSSPNSLLNSRLLYYIKYSITSPLCISNLLGPTQNAPLNVLIFFGFSISVSGNIFSKQCFPSILGSYLTLLQVYSYANQ